MRGWSGPAPGRTIALDESASLSHRLSVTMIQLEVASGPGRRQQTWMRLGDLDYCVAGSESAWKSAAVTVGCRRGRSLGLGPDSSSESEPQSEAGPYQTVLGRERWPGPGDWPGFK